MIRLIKKYSKFIVDTLLILLFLIIVSTFIDFMIISANYNTTTIVLKVILSTIFVIALIYSIYSYLKEHIQTIKNIITINI